MQCHVASLSPDEVTVLDGIELTTAARTIADLGRTLTFEQGVVAADGALHRGLTTPAALGAAVAGVVGTPGSRTAMRVVRFADGRSESVGESRSRVLIANAGLPPPTLQPEVFDGTGQLLGRSDFGWEEGKILGEFDGQIKYGRLLRPGQTAGDAVFREKRREDAMRDNGSRVVRWVWSELDNPKVVVERINRALGSLPSAQRP